MQCKKCGSTDVKIEMLTETRIKRKGKGLIWWLYFLTIGWIIELFLWLFLTLPRLIYALFKRDKYRIKSKTRKIAVCQNCGYSWKV